MKLRNILYSLLLLTVSTAQAQTVTNEDADKWKKWSPKDIHNSGWIIRAGYVIGGTTPLPLPKEIRHINEFSPLGGFTIGADYYHMFGKRVGIQFGAHLFYEGFHTSADVKNYKMAITQGNSSLSGYFTGTDVTDTKMFGITIPVTATIRISPRWNVNAGPFISFVGSGSFKGEVYDNSEGIGYLREGDPTGPKIEITRKNPASYDFSSDMRHLYWGMQVMFEWKALQHMNVFGGLDWGLSSIFPGDFETISFGMYPIYAKFGLAYRF